MGQPSRSQVEGPMAETDMTLSWGNQSREPSDINSLEGPRDRHCQSLGPMVSLDVGLVDCRCCGL